jgi:Tol biopolymer transport system component
MSMAFVLCCLSQLGLMGLPQTAGELLERALFLEEAKGKLGSAVTLYQRIADEFPNDRRAVARALYQIGRCYEKQGREEAQDYYLRVINGFSDLKDMVSRAKGRLSLLQLYRTQKEEENRSVKITLTWMGPQVDILGKISPDGRFVTYVDSETGDLCIRNLSSGTARNLTNRDVLDHISESAVFSIWSPDSQRIAYTWHNMDDSVDLRIIGFGESEPQLLYRTSNDIQDVRPFDWCRDGTKILALMKRHDGGYAISLISTEDCAVLPLKFLDSASSTNMGFSSDGEYIVFDAPQAEDPDQHDIFLYSLKDKKEVPLVTHPGDDLFLSWLPDGKRMLFLSNRSGEYDAWILSVDQGRPQRDNESLYDGLGRIQSFGMTAGGSFYYGITSGRSDTFTAPFSTSGGTASASQSRMTKPFIGSNFSAEWSPDGRSLAYLSQRGLSCFDARSNTLMIVNLDSHETRSLPLPLTTHSHGLHWAPDGRSFVIRGSDGKGVRGIYRIDIETGNSSLVVRDEKEKILYDPWMSLNGKHLYCLSFGLNYSRLVAVDALSGEQEEIYQTEAPAVIKDLAFSPRRDIFVFLEADRENQSLKIIQDRGEKPLELWRTNHAELIHSIDVSPDGRGIILSKSRKNNGQEAELCRLSIADKTLQKLASCPKEWRNIRIHPDGNMISFTAGTTETAVRKMENLQFIPSAPGGAHPTLQGVKYVKSDSIEMATGVAVAEGCLYISGVRNSPQKKGLLAKFSLPLQANPEWIEDWPARQEPGMTWDLFSDVAVTPEGIYLVGSGTSLISDWVGAREAKSHLIKYSLKTPDPNGEKGTVWERHPNFFPYCGEERFLCVCTNEEDGSSFVYATGFAQANSRNTSAVLAKYDGDGRRIWTKPLMEGSPEASGSAWDIACLEDAVYVTGVVNSNIANPSGSSHLTLWKFGIDGALQWERTWEGPGSYGYSLAVTRDAAYVTGKIQNLSGTHDILVLKYGKDGGSIWSQKWQNPGDVSGKGIGVRAGHLYVAGERPEAIRNNVILLELNSTDGSIISENFWGTESQDSIAGMVIHNKNIYIVGFSMVFSSLGARMMILHYSLE